ncbi:hypothetical protein [Brumicola blandensis]|uniref:Uncharacterized protein n=1 Tax=Brumicola blandensis TaxID=3075611 RepID=A0AAW8QXN8_9ALTE|nr:hypothetical protein [Alteromonas sp. W409]MDT0581529.1 hypothetical protein [Alteromonas sp. W409]
MNTWWGKAEFAVDECQRWSIGDRFIAVQRKQKEWKFWNIETKEETSDVLVRESLTISQLSSIQPSQRLLMRDTPSHLEVFPRLADRSMVIRPGTAITVLPDEEINLYVSTQLWVSFSIKDAQAPLYEIPLWAPSDSWFGVSNMVGELCYAKYSEANIELTDLKKRQHRVFTSIQIINEHNEPLVIQRIKIPMPLLNLYVDNDGQFWTDSICLTHNEDDNKPSFKILKMDVDDHKYTILSRARETGGNNVFISSLKSLIA